MKSLKIFHFWDFLIIGDLPMNSPWSQTFRRQVFTLPTTLYSEESWRWGDCIVRAANSPGSGCPFSPRAPLKSVLSFYLHFMAQYGCKRICLRCLGSCRLSIPLGTPHCLRALWSLRMADRWEQEVNPWPKGSGHCWTRPSSSRQGLWRPHQDASGLGMP